MDNRYESPLGNFTLNRNKGETNRSLRAWSSADQYILDNLESYGLHGASRILILNDGFGALAVPLAGFCQATVFSDSFCSTRVIEENLRENGMSGGAVRFLSPGGQLPGEIDLILLKNPKSLNYLEYELQLISSVYPPGIPVLAADMSRNIHSSTVSLFEHYLGDAVTSLAWRKARLIRGVTAGKREPLNRYPVEYVLPDGNLRLVNYPNLFAFGRLDPGSAFLVSRFPSFSASPERIIDLACGDGILALKAATLWPEASILCLDESWLAVRSARETLERNGFARRVDFMVTDGLDGVENNSTDLILCNPPFHDNYSLSTSTALKMFRQSRSVLREGGELIVIANRHLAYEKTLDALFSSVEITASSRKFSIIRALL